jgi:hypothetical protein
LYSSIALQQDDLHDRKCTSGASTLGDIIEVGIQHRVKMPACNRVYELLSTAIKDGNGVPSISPSTLRESIKVPFQSTKLLLSTTCAIAGACLALWVLITMLDVLLPREGL